MSIGNSVYSMILEWQRSEGVIPTSSVLSYKIRLNISTGNLDTSGMIHDF